MRIAGWCAVVILLACLAVPGRASIVTNGDFETGDFTGWYAYQTPFGGLLTINDYFNHTPGGTYSAAFGASGPAPYYDQLSQQLPTVVGDTYLVSFWLYPGVFTDPSNSSFQEYVNGFLGVDATNSALAGGWSLFNSTFTGTGDDALMFQGYNLAETYFLDNVSVTDTSAVPEPGTFGLLGCALVVAGAASRRLRRRA